MTAVDVSEASGLAQQLISEIELGKRPASETNLEALAQVKKLALSMSRMRAWRAADRIGKDDLWLILNETGDLVDDLYTEKVTGSNPVSPTGFPGFRSCGDPTIIQLESTKCPSASHDEGLDHVGRGLRRVHPVASRV